MKKPDIRHTVRHFCLECQGNSAKAVRECADEACALWPHRLPRAVALPETPEQEQGAELKYGAGNPPSALAGTATADGSLLDTMPSDGLPPSGAEPRDGTPSGPEPRDGTPSGSEPRDGTPSGPEPRDGTPSGPELVDGLPLSGPEPKDGLPPLGPKAREAQRRVLLRAVRRHCLSCAASREDVRVCAAREQCGLWSYRFGVRPETYRSVRERFLRPKTLSLFT